MSNIHTMSDLVRHLTAMTQAKSQTLETENNSSDQGASRTSFTSMGERLGGSSPNITKGITSNEAKPSQDTTKKITSNGFIFRFSANRIMLEFPLKKGFAHAFSATLVPSMPVFDLKNVTITYDESRDEDLMTTVAPYTGYIGHDKLMLQLLRCDVSTGRLVEVAKVEGDLLKELSSKNQVIGNGTWHETALPKEA